MTVRQETIEAYIAEHLGEVSQLIEDLCRIPAPLHGERPRAEFCKSWLERHGARAVRLDGADNAVLELCAQGSDRLTVFSAHTDTVFPDTEPMEVRRENGRMLCPGVGDDTANLAVLLLAARFLLEQGIRPRDGFLLAANSGEEGLGNLKGTRQLMADYAGRVARLISFDGYDGQLWNRAVGSSRYRVTLRTKGGHSFRDFGEVPNAIAELAGLIGELYRIDPNFGPVGNRSPAGSRTTYNVGVIRGGTSVNTIAQEASMLCEYRSDAAEGLAGMEQAFREIVERRQAQGADITVELLGTRPCASPELDAAAQQALTDTCAAILTRRTGRAPVVESGSTDCNIPLSLGIPAVSFGCCAGGGAHTRQEWIETASLERGLRIAIETMLEFA